MDGRVTRRSAVLAGLALMVVAGCARSRPSAPPDPRIAAVEDRDGVVVGVHAVDTGSGRVFAHRDEDRFLLAGVAAIPVAGAVLRRAQDDPGLLTRRVFPRPEVRVETGSVGERDLLRGRRVEGLLLPAVGGGGETAYNMLLDVLGGPAAATDALRALGDGETRLDRFQPQLVVADGDLDTTTPGATARLTRALLVDGALVPDARERLARSIGRGDVQGLVTVAPVGSEVTGMLALTSGGEVNEVAVVRAPGRAPVVVAVFSRPRDGSPPGTTSLRVFPEPGLVALEALGVSSR